MVLKKLLIILFLGAGLFIFSCEDTFDLDLQDNPNFPTPENANIEALYTSVQVNFGQFFNGDLNAFSLNDFTMMVSRQRAFVSGSDYANAYTAANFDGMWQEAYSDFLPDADELIKQAGERGLPFHGGSAKILKAYVLMTLVDVFGDVPYSESNQGAEIFSPKRDAGADIYAAAEALLDEAIADLGSEIIQPPAADNFFNGSVDGWVNVAKSLKIKLYVTTKLVDSSAGSKMMSIVNDADYAPTNFYFQYTSSRANPDSRHPFYEDSYETGDGNYQSNWLMWVMSKEKGIVDPRIRAYFYRQVPEIPLDNLNLFDCVFSPLPDAAATPQHYLDCDANMPYCVGNLESGYYGRDHGNGNGLPPDGNIRTLYGVYPAGGKFDANTFIGTQNSGIDGGLGAGAIPLMPANFIKFYRAEAALTMGTGEDARALLGEAVAESITNVLNFARDVDPASMTEEIGVNPITGDPILGSSLIPADSTITEYVDEVLSLYDAAADKLDVVMKEFHIAAYGNGVEGYNMIRRTGRPFNIQPMIQPTAGSFIRSAIYPAVHVTLNENSSQREVTEQVFWDTNPADFVK